MLAIKIFLFDKQQSKWIYDMQKITLYILADHSLNTRGIQIMGNRKIFSICNVYFIRS